jgi:hypothetical protein
MRNNKGQFVKGTIPKNKGIKTTKPNCICLICKNEFYICPSHKKRGGIYCSNKCHGISQIGRKGRKAWNKGISIIKQKQTIILPNGEIAVKINLSKDLFALIEDEDFDRVNQYKWFLLGGHKNKQYAKTGNGLLLHRFIMNVDMKSKNVQIDHINGNGLDNRKVNLRLATNQQNNANTSIRNDNTSGYKGVYYKKDREQRKKKWGAQININKKNISLGYFLTKEEAALAYNEAAIKYFGEFAYLNKVV